MSKIRTVFIFLIGLISLQSCAQKKHGSTCAVAFYNVENLFDTQDNPLKDDDEFTPSGRFHYTDIIYKQKLHNIAYAIGQMYDEQKQLPAIVGLAEIENSKVLAALVSQPELKKAGYKYLWYDGQDPRGINVAMLYNPSIFKLIRSITISIDGMSRDILYACGVLSGDTVHVLVNHWASRRDGKEESQPKRIAAAKKNRHIIDSITRVNPNANIMIMGDLNDNPDDVAVRDILNGKGDEHQVAKGSLFNPWMEIYKKGEGSLLFARHWDLFDHILLSPGMMDNKGWRYYKSEVYNREFLITNRGKFNGYPHRSFAGTRWINGFSDHLPVIIYLQKL